MAGVWERYKEEEEGGDDCPAPGSVYHSLITRKTELESPFKMKTWPLHPRPVIMKHV